MKQRRHKKMIAAKTALQVARRLKVRRPMIRVFMPRPPSNLMLDGLIDNAETITFVTYGTPAAFDNDGDLYEHIVGQRSSVL